MNRTSHKTTAHVHKCQLACSCPVRFYLHLSQCDARRVRRRPSQSLHSVASSSENMGLTSLQDDAMSIGSPLTSSGIRP